MRFGVVVFPGSNCDHDAWYAVSKNLGHSAEFIWHDSSSLGDVDAVILPGGFSYGDYLRCGAIAKFSPVMQAVREFASRGGLVIGICNGFQVLTEAGLLPGALQKNRRLRFLCTPTVVRIDSTGSVLTGSATVGTELCMPINHFSGSYVCDDHTRDELRREGRVVLRYVDNPNGSVDDIAGICSAAGNVVGLMPHPERASDMLLGSTDGLVLLRSLIDAAVRTPA